MANLVDDYKNMIPGGVRIRDGVVTVPNSSSPIALLDLFEGVMCYCNTYGIGNYYVDFDFESSVTAQFIVFNIPYDISYYMYTGSTTVENFKFNTYKKVTRGSSMPLYITINMAVNGSLEMYEYMYWLILRIA